MANSYQLLINGQEVSEEFYMSLTSLEVEENADLPGAVQLVLPGTEVLVI